MNIEICKKCLKDKDAKFYYNYGYDYKYQKYYYVTIGSCFRACKVDNRKRIETEIEMRKIFAEKKENLYFEIDENCPYYTEHQLYDWNNKK